MTDPKLSLNMKTTDAWSVTEAVDGCVRHGLEAIGLWREPVAAYGLEATAEYVRNTGLRVSSLCRGGFLSAEPGPDRVAAIADNRTAIDEAATLGAECLVLVVGGIGGDRTDLAGARARVRDALAELAEYVADRKVQLALEPLHPMYCADRAVLSTLGQALEWADPYPPEVMGVVIDTFHLWWDPQVEDLIAQAGGRIASFQVCDWITPVPTEDLLLARGMMGDGHIDFRTMHRAVLDAGYTGDVEVEIFNADIWATDPDQVMATMIDRYDAHVAI